MVFNWGQYLRIQWALQSIFKFFCSLTEFKKNFQAQKIAGQSFKFQLLHSKNVFYNSQKLYNYTSRQNYMGEDNSQQVSSDVMRWPWEKKKRQNKQFWSC